MKDVKELFDFKLFTLLQEHELSLLARLNGMFDDSSAPMDVLTIIEFEAKNTPLAYDQLREIMARTKFRAYSEDNWPEINKLVTQTLPLLSNINGDIMEDLKAFNFKENVRICFQPLSEIIETFKNLERTIDPDSFSDLFILVQLTNHQAASIEISEAVYPSKSWDRWHEVLDKKFRDLKNVKSLNLRKPSHKLYNSELGQLYKKVLKHTLDRGKGPKQPKYPRMIPFIELLFLRYLYTLDSNEIKLTKPELYKEFYHFIRIALPNKCLPNDKFEYEEMHERPQRTFNQFRQKVVRDYIDIKLRLTNNQDYKLLLDKVLVDDHDL